MIKRQLPSLLTYFRHGITNAMSEGIAAKIQALKKMANGFRKRDKSKTAIYSIAGASISTPTLTTELPMRLIYKATLARFGGGAT